MSKTLPKSRFIITASINQPIAFRLDRIADPSSTNRRFTPRPIPAADTTTYIRQTIASLRSVCKVELIVVAPIEAVQRHLGPWATASKYGADTTQIHMNIPDLGWAVLMLAVLNAEVRRVEPAELRTLLHELGHRFLSVGNTIDSND